MKKILSIAAVVRILKILAKFAIALFAMMIVCTIVWQTVVFENLYDCTDDNMLGFFTPGDWIHGPGANQQLDLHPVVAVDKVIHGRSMSEPDTIKKGWTVADLWHLHAF